MPVFELTDVEHTSVDQPAPSNGRARSWIDDLRVELDSYYTQIQGFSRSDITEVLMSLAAMSARASELRGQVVRIDARAANAFRTKELEPFLDALDFQFRCHSRIQAVREHEFKLSGGFA